MPTQRTRGVRNLSRYEHRAYSGVSVFCLLRSAPVRDKFAANIMPTRAGRSNYSSRDVCWMQQVSGKGKRSLETKLLKVYVKLLARLLRDSEKDNFGINDQGSNG